MLHVLGYLANSYMMYRRIKLTL